MVRPLRRRARQGRLRVRPVLSRSTSASSRTTSPAAWRGPKRSARPACSRPTSTLAIDRALTALLDAVRQDPRIVQGDDEDVHAWVERQLVERVGDAGKRLHTGPLAQRAGQRRSAALPAAAADRDRSPDRARRRGARRAGRTGRRRADAGLHASAARAARARRALVPVARRRVPPRRRAHRRGVARGRRAAARARARSPATPTASTCSALARAPRVLARRRQQHGRRRRSRLRVVVPPRRVAVHGARQPARRGHHHLRQRGVRLHRSRRSRSRPAAA